MARSPAAVTAGARPWLIGFGVCLTGLAGYVDALGFIRLGGLFASFMSGNTTQLGVGIGRAQAHLALASATVILAFALGAALGGALMAAAAPRWRAAITLAVEAGAVSAAYAAAGLTGGGPGAPAGFPHEAAVDLASAFLALGMGAQNAVLAGVEGFRAGATFVTGALSGFSRKLGAALVGRGDRLAWVGEGAVWLSFALGAGAGTLAHAGLGLHAFAVPVCAAGASAALALVLAVRGTPIEGSHRAG